MKKLLLIAAALAAASCALPASYAGRSTAQLTTPGIVALHSVGVVKVLDVVRDVAIDGEATKVITADDAKKIVEAHKAILQDIKAAPTGWKQTVLAAIYNLRGQLSASALAIVGPYIESSLAIIKAVIQ